MSKWKYLPLAGVSLTFTSCAQVLDSMVESALDSDDSRTSERTRDFKRQGYDIDTSYRKAHQETFENDFFNSAGRQ